MIAVNHHRACNVAQPLTPCIDLLPRLRDRGCRTITAQACAAADRRRASRSDSSRWRKNQRAEEEETATLIPRFSRSSGEHPPMSISSAIKSASSRWLSWRSECRCGAWHPEIISPCGASPRCSRSRQVSNATCAPMLCPASKSGVSGDTDASSSFASSAASCVMLLSGSRWRRRSRPGQSPEKARNQPVAQLASGETRYCCRQRKGT